jgi:hypothetical protein
MKKQNNNLAEFNLDFTRLDSECLGVMKYLHRKMAIDFDIAEYFIKNKLLYQDRPSGNAIFPVYDEDNIIVGAEEYGTLENKRFKTITQDTKDGYGFNARFSDDNTFDFALFFVNALDLISFVDYKKSYEKKSLKKCVLISMSGLNIDVVKHSLTVFKGKLTPVMCVGNNKAGQDFRQEMQDEKISFIDSSPAESFSNWNEHLTCVRKSGIPISRLVSRGILRENKGITGQKMINEGMRKGL